MAVYLKKKKLYEIVKKIMTSNGKEIPLLKYCEYQFYRGTEWLKFSGIKTDYHYYKISAEAGGNFLCIEEIGCKPYEQEVSLLRKEVYRNLQADGTYLEKHFNVYN